MFRRSSMVSMANSLCNFTEAQPCGVWRLEKSANRTGPLPETPKTPARPEVTRAEDAVKASDAWCCMVNLFATLVPGICRLLQQSAADTEELMGGRAGPSLFRSDGHLIAAQ